MDFAHQMDSALILAAFALPVWVIWRLPSYLLSLPVGMLVFWALAVIDGFLLRHVDLEYDSIAPALMVFFGAPLGLVYCLLWVAVREAILPLVRLLRVRRQSARAQWVHTMAGLAIWTGLCLFCLTLPVVYAPPGRSRGSQFLKDYFFVCSPILLVAVTMSAMYLVQLIRLRLATSREQTP